jgi:hypothetical protein
MPITVEKLQDEPIILVICQEPINYLQEAPAAFDQILALRDSIHGSSKYYIVFDASMIKIDFSSLVFLMGELNRASEKRRADLPLSVSLVGSGGLIELAAAILQHQQYGDHRPPLFNSVDQALASVRADLTI